MKAEMGYSDGLLKALGVGRWICCDWRTKTESIVYVELWQGSS